MMTDATLAELAIRRRSPAWVRTVARAALVAALALLVVLSVAIPTLRAQTYDPFLGQWIDVYGNVVPAPNQAAPQAPAPAPTFQPRQPAPSLPRLQAAPSSPPPLPAQKGQLALPSDRSAGTPSSFDASESLSATPANFDDQVEPAGAAPQDDSGLAANPASGQPAEATAAILDIEEPEPTGLLFTEPLGLLALGEGALVLDPALMEDEPNLDALLTGTDREQRLQQLGLGDKIALLSTSEEAERKRNQVLFQRALQERDPPLPRRFARLRAMEKITARMTTIDVPVGQTATFGTVQITPRACYENPPTEPPESATFLEIIDQPVARDSYQVFNGWMFASSPALSAMDHPIYDVWVLACLDIE